MKQIRIALSGAGFRIPGHVGALKAIVEAGYGIPEIVGTSAGSIIAALYATGMTIGQMEQLSLTQNWSSMLTCDPISGWLHNGWCGGENLFNWLADHTNDATFSDISIDLKIVASDLVTEKQVVFSRATSPNMTIAEACRCSASIPFVYAPVCINGMILVDGGTADNMPADLLTIDNIPRLGIYLVSDDPVLSPGRYSLPTLAGRVIDLMLASNELAHIGDATLTGANIVRVQTGFAPTLNTNMPTTMRQQLIDAGYMATKSSISMLKNTIGYSA